MASSFQQKSRLRKVIYGVLILGLFTATLLWRHVLEASGNELALRESNQGEVELTGAALRLSLTGSRGLVLCALWADATEKKRKQEWNELELRINQITKIQPHLIKPWLFQSWNLAYNVSHDCEQVRDKYYYIVRGIQLLADGERQNRNNPDLRFELGHMYKDKLGISDQSDMLRALFHLSCIDPAERDPRKLRNPKTGEVDLKAFEAFCVKFPHLVRRLREMQGTSACQTPDDVVNFLSERREIDGRVELEPLHIPGRYQDGERDAEGRLKPFTQKSKLKPPDKQFPVLPTERSGGELNPNAEFPEYVDNYKVAQIWFTHAQEPLPPPRPLTEDDGSYDQTRYRMPSKPTSLIFRGYPSLIQAQYAEQLENEGWFDEGWEVDAGRLPEDRWFSHKVVVGQGLAQDAWEKARKLRDEFGKRTGLLMDAEVLKKKTDEAKKFEEAYSNMPGRMDDRIKESELPTEELRRSYRAHKEVAYYHAGRRLTNFAAHYAQAEVESTKDAIQARKLFFKAEQRRKADDRQAAISLYEEAFPIWRKALTHYARLCQDPNDAIAYQEAQEATYRFQYYYLKLLRDRRGARYARALDVQESLARRGIDLKPLLLAQDLVGRGALPLPGICKVVPAGNLLLPGPVVEKLVEPFAGNDQWDHPWISEQAIRQARFTMGFRDPPPKPAGK